MKTISAGLTAHLAGGETTLAWCWRVERRDGVTLGFTEHDRPLTFLGTTFEPEAGFAASEIRAGSDMAVDAQDAEGVLSSERITETDIASGLWDDAVVEIWRVNWADTSERVLMRRGAIGEIRRGRVAFVAEMRSLAHLLNQSIGRTFQPVCDAELGDARCGVDLEDSDFKGTGAVTSVLRDRAFIASGLGAFADGWFALGKITWTSGANDGWSAEVMLHEAAGGAVTITLLEAPAFTIDPGDDFVIRAGCDKRITTCSARFSNAANFRGFPHIPGLDAVLRYATRDSGHVGEVL